MTRTQAILFAALAALVLFIIVLPEHKKEGEQRELFDYNLEEFQKVEYQGDSRDHAGKDIKVHYSVTPKRNPHVRGGYQWQIDVHGKEPSRYMGGQIVKTMIDESRRFVYLYKIEDNPERRKDYGFEGCESKFTVHAIEKHVFCIGTWNYGKSRRYVWQMGTPNVYLAYNYTMSRFQKDIHTYRDFRLHQFDKDMVTSFEVVLHRNEKKRFPKIFSKTKGTLVMKVRPAKEGAEKRRPVWQVQDMPTIASSFVEGLITELLGINLSHFARKKVATKDKPAISATYFTSEDRTAKPTQMGYAYLYRTAYRKSWPIIKSAKGLGKRPALAVSSAQSGIYSLGTLNNVLVRIDRIETELTRQEEHEAQERERQRQILERTKMDAPKPPEK